jgi:hypothetical protein
MLSAEIKGTDVVLASTSPLNTAPKHRTARRETTYRRAESSFSLYLPIQ